VLHNIEKALKKYWGYDGFLPFQQEAMKCVVGGKDSVVVLPTGGGKSLCFQAPAVVMPGLTVVVSPLISLMKDQVDALCECGVSAARLDSSLSYGERSDVVQRIRNQTLKLLYLAPERLVSDGFTELLKDSELATIAIDEAHCISRWGHDFRPEDRQLGTLKEKLTGITVHAYTATATRRVRQDIAEQLHLNNPEMMIGSFDRPNLVYKAERRTNRLRQVQAILDRHKDESGIIYCIRRADVDELCAHLSRKGYRAAPYHAGMEDEDRKQNQDAFIAEKVDTIVATVAFGMGIDKSNVRYVIHTGMPKSLEHYQQESGRAGRDGLEAECCLFYSGGDYGTWKSIMGDIEDEQAYEIAIRKLNDMYGYCTGMTCRHRAILNYFGQDLDKKNCAACDVCLGDMDYLEDSLITAQKILSSILRQEERFGAEYTTMVLIGSQDQRILDNGHDGLSTYGLLADRSKRMVRDWVEQLVDQGFAQKTGEFNVLTVTAKGRQVLKGEETPRLLKPVEKKAKKVSKAVTDSWEGVDRGLFEELRKLRRQIAQEKGVPAYVVFDDATLRDMARKCPITRDAFIKVKGVGEQKNKQYGRKFITAIKQFCLDEWDY
jgi:ATP-dependent DNA helicase RecQ